MSEKDLGADATAVDAVSCSVPAPREVCGVVLTVFPHSSCRREKGHDGDCGNIVVGIPSRVHEARSIWLQREVREALMRNGSLTALFGGQEKDILIDAVIVETLESFARITYATMTSDQIDGLSPLDVLELVADCAMKTSQRIGKTEYGTGNQSSAAKRLQQGALPMEFSA